MRRLAAAALVVVSIALVPLTVRARQSTSSLGIGAAAFESYIELLRQQAGIPGMSGALIQDGVVVWERGLGFANQEARIHATADTPYPISDLTQLVSTVLLLQCVEQRHLRLDEPLALYGVSPPVADVTMAQVLSHTSTSEENGRFRYNPERFGSLTQVMEHCAPQPFRKSVAHRVLEFLSMLNSVPGRDIQNAAAAPEGLFDASVLERYARVLERLAVPYKVDRRLRATRTEVPVDSLTATTGLVSSARDLARFDIAVDQGLLLREETVAAARMPRQPNDVATGLGWFVQNYRGTQIVWHFGVIPNAYSALIVKVPARRATMILLANTDALAIPLQSDAADVTRSLFASVFLRMLL